MTTAELRSFFDRFIERYEEMHQTDEIKLIKDDFWSVPFPEIYQIYEKGDAEPSLTIGSLYNCLEFLRSESGGEISWSGVWLGQLLMAIAHTARP